MWMSERSRHNVRLLEDDDTKDDGSYWIQYPANLLVFVEIEFLLDYPL